MRETKDVTLFLANRPAVSEVYAYLPAERVGSRFSPMKFSGFAFP
jgi:hypothetical protein